MSSFIKAALRLSAVAVAAVSLPACATVVRGIHEDYHVESTPPGASVQTSTGYTCTTPCTMRLPRKNEFDITVALDGYKTYSMRIVNEISGAGAAGLVGNAVVGGPLGVGVDVVTGASQDLKPNPLIVNLAPNDSAGPSTSNTAHPTSSHP